MLSGGRSSACWVEPFRIGANDVVFIADPCKRCTTVSKIGVSMSTKAKHTALLVLSWVFMASATAYALVNRAERVAVSVNAPAN